MDEDCPPGAEGYQDSVTERAKNPLEDPCTKVADQKICQAEGRQPYIFMNSTSRTIDLLHSISFILPPDEAEQEFQEHLNSLRIKLEDGETKPMVERRSRDISGKWIYLCFPCAAMCSGESVLQTHISGKKHKTKLAMRNVWPKSIFEEHPYILHEKGTSATKGGGTSEKVLQKMAEEVDLHNKPPSELDLKYNKYREVRCHIQDTIDVVKAPLLGLEYLIEHPPEQSHYEPSYICVLCSKQGHPRTIMNHMTCYWHRYNYLVRHFNKACGLLAPYRGQNKYREGVFVIINRLAQRIEDKYGRLRPVNIDKEEYERDKERIHQWIFKSKHFSEQTGPSFEEVVDVDLINTLHKSSEESKVASRAKDPSPPVVVAPTKPNYRRNDRRNSLDALSDISDEVNQVRRPERDDKHKDRHDPRHDSRYKPYEDRRRAEEPSFRSRYAIRNPAADKKNPNDKEKTRAPNYEYKLKLADDKRKSFEDSAKKTLAYHEKNPEKHPLYPEEWKKFWNRRYKEIQAEGKDPAKHDFKPEWIVFWRARMKELHDEELRINILELYRKLCLSPPDMDRRSESKRRSVEPKPRSVEPKRRSPEPRRRSPEPRRRSPDPRRRSPDPRRRSPDPRRKSLPRRRSPEMRRHSPELRRHSPERRRTPMDYRRDRRSPEYRRHSPPMRHLRTRSRSPMPRARSPPRTHINLDSLRRSRSPLSRRDEASRNRSPAPEPHLGPASQTVMISDDELKPDDNLSPWNSDNDMDSLGSLPEARSPVRPRSYAGSVVSSRASRSRQFPRDYGSHHGNRSAEPQDLGPAENVVATLRMLVALEDYLGSLGPKIVDLLTEALKMEKEKPNSSEELLDREAAVVLIETAKEKLKGAMQAGLVPPAASAALRAAVVRAATTLHEADRRANKLQQSQASSKAAAAAGGGGGLPVAGVGEVDRAQIAQQMAAALIAQGKTDVSSEELAQLVEAVVGMAEAKKREAEIKKKQEARAMVDKASRPQPASATPGAGSASALQMLQSAYDENDKRAEKEDAPDAMDGLSDSDLETLLKNFNELSAEEQHSLIAYLKKLEAREPQRVERLRQYVSAAATPAAAPAPPPPPPPAKPAPAPAPATAPAPSPAAARPEPPATDRPATDNRTVTIESDDDDYTVEEVFKSVNQKVKEDQIRQEMEIVKKSLEESKVSPVVPKPAASSVLTNSSAASLLALVQASIQSTSGSSAPAAPGPVDVVASATQPRSFGDRPDPPTDKHIAPLIPTLHNQGYRPPINNNFGGSNQANFSDPNQGNFEGPNPGTFGSPNQGNFDRPNQDAFRGPNQSNFEGPNQGAYGGPNQSNFEGPNQGAYGGPNQSNFEGPNQGAYGGPNQSNFEGPNQGAYGGPNQSNFEGPNQGAFGGQNQSNFEGPNVGAFGGQNQSNFEGPNQGAFGGPSHSNFGGLNQPGFGGPIPAGFGGPNQAGFGGPNQAGCGVPNQQDGFDDQNPENFGMNQGNFGGPNQGGGPSNFGGNRNFPNQNQQISPWEKDAKNDNMMDNRGAMRPGFDKYGSGPNQFNPGPRGNFMNGRMQDNFDTRPQMNQQPMGNNFQGNNYQGNRNFRGRGGRGGRGRGRGFY